MSEQQRDPRELLRWVTGLALLVAQSLLVALLLIAVARTAGWSLPLLPRIEPLQLAYLAGAWWALRGAA